MAKLIEQINQIIAQVRQTNPKLANFIGKNPTLSNLQYQVQQAAKSAQTLAGNAANTGIMGGVGQAAANAYNNPTP